VVKSTKEKEAQRKKAFPFQEKNRGNLFPEKKPDPT